MITWTIIAGSALMAFTSPNVAYAQSLPEPLPVVQEATSTESIKSLVEARFGANSAMSKVAGCESSYTQFSPSGRPLKNPGSSATGVFQILASVHRASALKMGLDIDTTLGNLGYAEVLYKANGLVPWEESRKCWDR